MQDEKDIPFEGLDKRWVELLCIAFEEGAAAGYDPAKYYMYVDLIYLKSRAFYIFSFYEKEYDSWNYEATGRDFNITIAVSNFKETALERQKGFHRFLDEDGKMKY